MSDIGVSLETSVLCGFGENHAQEDLLDYFGSCQDMLSVLKKQGVKFIEIRKISYGEKTLALKTAFKTVFDAGLDVHLYINLNDKVYANEFCDYFEQIHSKLSFVVQGIANRSTLSENRKATSYIMRNFADESKRRGLDYKFYLENGSDMSSGYLCQECEQIQKELMLVSRKSVRACMNLANRVINTRYADKELPIVPEKRVLDLTKHIIVSNVSHNGKTEYDLSDPSTEIKMLLNELQSKHDVSYCIRLNPENCKGNPGKDLIDSINYLKNYTK